MKAVRSEGYAILVERCIRSLPVFRKLSRRTSTLSSAAALFAFAGLCLIVVKHLENIFEVGIVTSGVFAAC
jgi:hypothetical protein